MAALMNVADTQNPIGSVESNFAELRRKQERSVELLASLRSRLARVLLETSGKDGNGLIASDNVAECELAVALRAACSTQADINDRIEALVNTIDL